MSLAKYMQFYRNKGFFNGSIIRVTITDDSYYGCNLILSRGTTIIQSKVVIGSVTEFFTNAGGNLSVSCDNGQAIISAEVNVSVYGTYEITLNSINSNSQRQIYPDSTDVIFFSGDTQKKVKFAYTGDIAPTTVTTSDDTVATATINENEITITKVAGETEAECNITATVSSSADYPEQSQDIRIKRIGNVGSWSDASDETIVQMVELADQGRLNLRDYWQVGESRRVNLSAIVPDPESVIIQQPAQEIELVLMHDSIEDLKYSLVTPTASHRTRPSFIVGMKDCLQNLTPVDFISGTKTLTTYKDSDTFTTTFNYKSMSIDSWLNNNFFNALPSALAEIFKTVNVPWIKTDMTTLYSPSGATQPAMGYMYNLRGAKAQKVSLPSIYEITGMTVENKGYDGRQYLQFRTSYQAGGKGQAYEIAYEKGGAIGLESLSVYDLNHYQEMDLTYEGTRFEYYDGNNYPNSQKKRGTNEYVAYYTRTDMDLATAYKYRASGSGSIVSYAPHISAFGIKTATNDVSLTSKYPDSGDVTTFNKEDFASTYYGISPILFI